ncbi:diguanylate cyclase (GGDEF)-like protein [Gluconacetobacter liquefaciens]|uniref:diguanylate cyclase n=1 Tax=Gluconacetobacter liquefaciens TaxID=89584 RepID=A0A370G199_GLULI|nr:diguanylate cyclase (GGDEF)-like protein [Gluconacetobacter liquefaciens]
MPRHPEKTGRRRSHLRCGAVLRVAPILCAAFLTITATLPLQAQTIATTLHDASSGLTNTSVLSAIQLPAGQILATTQEGFFFFDGRQFLPLGPAQGLPPGAPGAAAALTSRGDLILVYADMIYVAHDLATAGSPDRLHFVRVDTGDLLSHDSYRKIEPWRDGLVITEHDHLLFVHPDGTGERIDRLATILSLKEDFLRDVSALHADGDTLWIGTGDGHLCALGKQPPHCPSLPPLAAPRRMEAIVQDHHGTLYARTLHEFVTVPPAPTPATVEKIPHAEGQYENYQHFLTMSWSPAGKLVTQTDDGQLAVLAGGEWKIRSLDGEQSTSPLSTLLFDRQGALWIGRMGFGLARTRGFAVFETFGRRNGLAGDVIWQVIRQPGGPLWITTDTGISALDTHSDTVLRTIPHAAFFIAADHHGCIWHDGPDGVSRHDLLTDWQRDYPIKRINQILPGLADDLWLLSDQGAWLADTARRDQPPAQVPGLSGSYSTGFIDAAGTLWLLEGRHLLARHRDGSQAVVLRTWPLPTFVPYLIKARNDHQLWIAGHGGLYRLTHAGDRVTSLKFYGPTETGNNTLYNLLIDRRNRVWTGSSHGLSVFDGQRWTTITEADGLASNDLDQDSLLEDADGSLWIGTSRGLSHLVQPDDALRDMPLQPVITAMTLGEHPYHGEKVRYSRAPLHVTFGTLDYRDAPRIHFRYRLEGADDGWNETGDGSVRYPSMPPGTHRFLLMAYDPGRNQHSAIISARVEMAYPWWERWPVLLLATLFFLLAGYMVWRIRVGLLIKQRRKLQEIVHRQTEEIRSAHQALIRQARLDSLTGLLNRGAIQTHLQACLAEQSAEVPLAAGLVDVDHFKQINDGWGHLAGDEVLTEIGRILRRELRPEEAAGRYGGEEFLVVLTGQEPAGDRMRTLCRFLNWPLSPDRPSGQHVTVSAGVAEARPGETWQSLIGRADKALYRAKAEGRDRVIEAP